MNQEELLALVELLNRASVSRAERMWVQGLVNRLETEMRGRDRGVEGRQKRRELEVPVGDG